MQTLFGPWMKKILEFITMRNKKKHITTFIAAEQIFIDKMPAFVQHAA